MKCRQAKHLLFDFVDGMSNEALRAELDRHLGTCPECDRFAGEMTRCLALVHRTPVEPLDENFNWKVRLAIHRERNALRSRSVATGAWARAWNLRYAMGTGVAFGAVLVAGALMLRTGPVDSGLQAGLNSAGSARTLTNDAPRTMRQVATQHPPLVPQPTRSGTRSPGIVERFVTNGGSGMPMSGNEHAPDGAIDESTTDATIDSLVSFDLRHMTPAERAAYIQRRIIRLQLHLQSQQETGARR